MRLTRQPGPWLAGFGLWLAALWWLSSRTHDAPAGLGFPHLDKVVHFGWFFGGAGLLAAALHGLRPGIAARASIIFVTLALGLVGVLDEFHQSFTAGRDGNDPGDLLADLLGAFAGACVFRMCRPLFSPDD